jgi:hypothetical protein
MSELKHYARKEFVKKSLLHHKSSGKTWTKSQIDLYSQFTQSEKNRCVTLLFMMQQKTVGQAVAIVNF